MIPGPPAPGTPGSTDRTPAGAAAVLAARQALCEILAARRDPRRLDPAAPRPWVAMASLADRQRIKPLLFAILRASDLEVPPALRADLQAHYYRTVAMNAWSFHELGRILTAFDRAGVPVILLKGAALAEAVYPDRGTRPMVDIDLLVPPTSARAAIRLAAELGYTPQQAEPRGGLATAFESETLLVRSLAPHSALELHWNLLDSPYYQQRLPLAWFWETSRSITIHDGVPARIFGPEAQILYLCAHLALHHGGGEALDLLWRHDIAEVLWLYAGAIDWPRLLEQARACELVLPLQRTLPLVARDWRLELPADCLAAVGRLEPSPEERRVYRRLAARHRSAAERLRDDLSDIQGWRRRLRFAWYNLCPSPAYMRQRYGFTHPAWLPLAYPYRWLRGLAAWLQATWRR